MTPFITIRTHKGLFHADEVFACAIIQIYENSDLPIARLNHDERIEQKFAYIIDTMRVYDPESKKFDHHQFNPKDPQPELLRGNGIPYASAGLVWKYLGPKIQKNQKYIKEVVDRVDKTLIQQIDAHDADSSFYASASASGNEVRLTTLSNIISSFNTDDIHDDIAQHKAFLKAVKFAKKVVKDSISNAYRYTDSVNKFDSIIEKISTHIIYLPEYLPWKEIVRENYPDVMFVITKSSHIEGEFALNAVPVHPAKRDLLIPIERPEWFKGFIHAGKFIAGCKSIEEAIDLANWNGNPK